MVIYQIFKTENLSTVRCLRELDKDNPVREGGRQEGSDKKRWKKLMNLGSNSSSIPDIRLYLCNIYKVFSFFLLQKIVKRIGFVTFRC